VGFGFYKMPQYAIPKVAGATLALACYGIGAYIAGIKGIAWGSIIANVIYVALVLAANQKIIMSFRQNQKLGSICTPPAG
jgi:ABC-type protease/lipase transport system fused ATPase/permease subunit